MQEASKRIRQLEDEVVALRAVARHERQSRRQELKGREREIRHLSNALYRKGEEIRVAKAEVAKAWQECRERMAAAGLDARGNLLAPKKTNGDARQDTMIPPPLDEQWQFTEQGGF
jgi:hypothetical protein